MHTINSFYNPSAHLTVAKIIKRFISLKPPDVRRSNSIDLLRNLLSCLNFICSSNYQKSLFTAMFLTAFFGMLRLRQFTRGHKSDHVIMLNDIYIDIVSVTITLRSFKHSSGPVTICFRSRNDISCPYSALKSFKALRGSHAGPLLACPNGEGIHRAVFSCILHVCILLVPI